MNTNRPADAELRVSEVVSTYGVGAIVDIKGESFVAPDTSYWSAPEEIEADRLLAKIGPGTLKRPATMQQMVKWKNKPGMKLVRFPAWRFCDVCTRLSKYGRTKGGRQENRCSVCKSGWLVPMRFVAGCEMGSHLQEIPWVRWVHAKSYSPESQPCTNKGELYFGPVRGQGEGLKSLQVECRACKTTRTLDELVGNNALTMIGIQCEGKQPWEHDRAGCVHPVSAVLRGATKLFRAEFVSALDIPKPATAAVSKSFEMLPSKRSDITHHQLFESARKYIGSALSDDMVKQIASDLGVEIGLVQSSVLSDDPSDIQGRSDTPNEELKLEEWAAFQERLKATGGSDSSNFVVDACHFDRDGSPDLSDQVLSRFGAIGKVRRLREVRAQVGYSRNNPGAAVIPTSPHEGPKRSFPTAELFGEGLLVTFSEENLKLWEQSRYMQDRSDLLSKRREGLPWAQRLGDPSPRTLMIHTFSHALMRRLAFESGYDTAALRERIYSSETQESAMSGVLIYAAAPDEQGTLGGLVRLADPNRLQPLIANALESVEVCSNDPICIETDTHQASSLNLSACHGCCLVSETSCEYGNRYLDRQSLIGTFDDPAIGFFGDWAP